MKKKTIVIAAGGTGGHLYPAQALAKQLIETSSYRVLFVSHGLTKNPYFDRENFEFCDISSATFFGSNPIRAALSLSKGIAESYKTIHKVRPDLVVGFGSYHSFPILSAARLKKLPYILFESNAIPGKVTRLFSKNAHQVGYYLPFSQPLKGKIKPVNMPFSQFEKIEKGKARTDLGLDPHRSTMLIVGGSQGALTLNERIESFIPSLDPSFQVIHLTGKGKREEALKQAYAKRQIPAYVNAFESQMERVYAATDFALCRSGAVTLAELITHTLPAILVPHPWSPDDHQTANARFFTENLRGGQMIFQDQLKAEHLNHMLSAYPTMKKQLESHLELEKRFELFSLIEEALTCA